MNFAAVDLNLLRVFDAMMVETSTVRAGERLGLSQPAVSAALGRLRRMTGDELFVREGNRMVATPKALAMREPVREALWRLEEALGQAVGFDPATSERAFAILGSDYFSTLLMPRLAQRVTPAAPKVTLQMLAHPSADVFRLLREGRVDVAVDRELEPPDWIARRTLHRSYVLTAARRGHPELAAAGVAPGERIPPEVFCAVPQVLMSMDGGRTGTIDPLLAAKGLARRVAMTVANFHAVALTAATTPLIGNLPVHFAHQAADVLDLDLYLPPFDPPILDICLYWHRRLDRDPANAWLRGHIAEAMELAAARPPPAAPCTDGAGWQG